MTDEAQDANPDELRTGADIKADAIANLFAAKPGGVAAFKAFVSEEFTYSDDPNEERRRRLYTDDTGWEWVEARSKDVIGQLPVGLNPNDPRSIVFVERDAVVTMCTAGYASEMKDEALGVDARGGPNPPKKRKPPY